MKGVWQQLVGGFAAPRQEGGKGCDNCCKGCGSSGWSFCCQIAHLLLWPAQQQMPCLASLWALPWEPWWKTLRLSASCAVGAWQQQEAHVCVPFR